MEDLVYVWADGTWCYRDELEEFTARCKGTYEVMTQQEFFSEGEGK
jgi:hypothetical protein